MEAAQQDSVSGVQPVLAILGPRNDVRGDEQVRISRVAKGAAAAVDVQEQFAEPVLIGSTTVDSCLDIGNFKLWGHSRAVAYAAPNASEASWLKWSRYGAPVMIERSSLSVT